MITFDHLQRAITLTQFDGFTAQMGMAPVGRERMYPKPDNPPRQSAVLVLIYPRLNSGLHLLLTKRTSHLRGHSGQISFPGGRQDDTDSSLEYTALREACEEVGICQHSQVNIIGRLSKMWIPPTNFDVHPIVATMPAEPEIIPNPAEVAAVLHMPLRSLIDDATKQSTQMQIRDMNIEVPYYDVEGQIVWGATAGMLSELELRLKTVLNS